MESSSLRPPLMLRFDDEDFDITRTPWSGYTDLEAFEVLRRYVEDRADFWTTRMKLRRMMPAEEPKDPMDKRVYDHSQENVAFLILDLADQTPYHHPAQTDLAKMLIELSRNDRYRKLLNFTGDGYLEWFHELGTWTDWEEPSEAEQKLNEVAFQARLVQWGYEASQCKANLMARTLVYVLERRTRVEMLAPGVAIAAVWVLCAIHPLYHLMVLDTTRNEEIKSRIGAGELYDGPLWGLERWTFWQRRFHELCDDQELPILEEHRDLGRRAARLMAAFGENVTF